MKKILIPDEYICAIFSTVGYGLGYSIPCALGVPGWLSAENAEKLKNWDLNTAVSYMWKKIMIPEWLMKNQRIKK